MISFISYWKRWVRLVFLESSKSYLLLQRSCSSWRPRRCSDPALRCWEPSWWGLTSETRLQTSRWSSQCLRCRTSGWRESSCSGRPSPSSPWCSGWVSWVCFCVCTGFLHEPRVRVRWWRRNRCSSSAASGTTGTCRPTSCPPSPGHDSLRSSSRSRQRLWFPGFGFSARVFRSPRPNQPSSPERPVQVECSECRPVRLWWRLVGLSSVRLNSGMERRWLISQWRLKNQTAMRGSTPTSTLQTQTHASAVTHNEK